MTFEELRKKNHFTQRELAGKLNVSKQTVWLWEHRKAKPHSGNIYTIARMFDLSIKEAAEMFR